MALNPSNRLRMRRKCDRQMDRPRHGETRRNRRYCERGKSDFA